MVKKNLTIEDFEDKKTKADKRYTRFKTSEGWMSCFDAKSSEKLKDSINKEVCCEVATSGDFQNIKKFIGPAEEQDTQDEDTAEVEVDQPGKKETPKKTYELTDGNIRSNALRCAIEACKLNLAYEVNNHNNLLGVAKSFEAYIRTGN